MGSDPKDLENLLLKIRYDATAIQAKITAALEELANMNIPKPAKAGSVPCLVCGVVRSSEIALLEHMENVHGVLA